ncbi:MAG: SurA N-terminal domain-containing protein [Bacteroidia bacterium]
MSTLERLRKRSGLLVAIVGLALLAFVLTGLFERGSSLFGNGREVGEIAGVSIDLNVFRAKVEEQEETMKRNQNKTSLSPEETDGIVQQVWNQLINEHVLLKEYDKLGIAISDEELYDLMVTHPHPALVRNLSDPQTGKVAPMFANPQTGLIDPAKIKEFTASMTDEQEAQWAELEEYVRQVRVIEKYNNLIKKGLYVTKSAAKREYLAQNTTANIKYVVKDYKLLADSTIKPTDADLNEYYAAHQNEFKQDASRNLEYVSWDIAPSQEDIDEAKKNMENVAKDFKASKSYAEDSAFVIAESQTRNFDQSFHTAGTLSPMIDTTFFKAEVGTVIGPYEENGLLKVSKLIAVKTSADSAKIRHILIAYKDSGTQPPQTRTKEQAKKLADSLLTAIKKGAKFTDIVEKYSDDGGKKMPPNKKPGEDYMGKGGDYGWVNANSGFVEPFKNAGLDNKKGDLVIVESNFGYHIIEVLDSKGSQKKVQVGTIEYKPEASSKTKNAIYSEATNFAGNNKTIELFHKAVADKKMNKRVVEKLKENDKTIPGIEQAKQLVRWAYENEKGTVSEPQEYGDKYLVSVITEVREKGIAPLEQVKEEVTAKVIQQKKAEIFTKEFADAMNGATTVDAISAKMKLPVEQAPNVNFMTNQIPGSQSEPAVIGEVSVQKANTLSKPLAGKEGVFVVYVEKITPAQELKDYSGPQKSQMQNIQPRVDYEVFEALKENANIQEHLVKYGY